MSRHFAIARNPGARRTETYDPVAAEYYDEILHPTCAAFGIASLQLLQAEITEDSLSGMVVCDIGAGSSQVAKLIGAQIRSLESLWLVDSSPQMLAWSEKYKLPNVFYRVHRAEELNLLGKQFDIIICSLGDPYNVDKFWSAVANSLKQSGRCFFTTPSYEWAQSFRSQNEDEVKDEALFVLANGERHYVPSYILTYEDQIRLIERHGLKILKSTHAYVDCLKSVPPKLFDMVKSEPIVTMYEVGAISE